MMQAFRQGMREAWNSAKRFRVFLGVGLVALLIGAQLVRLLPLPVMLIAIGLPVTALCDAATARCRAKGKRAIQQSCCQCRGLGRFYGGLIWHLGATNSCLSDCTQNRQETTTCGFQGVIYGLGAVATGRRPYGVGRFTHANPTTQPGNGCRLPSWGCGLEVVFWIG